MSLLLHLNHRQVERIGELIIEAVLAEREACAAIAEASAQKDRENAARLRGADNSFDDCAITAEVIAKAIRERPQKD